ncbi:ABC transporter permease [Ensifer sp.]|uniref:ABC transporter permease n=1 Tax=Ensifer sp. TaxID=1872086 RepID=UPI002E103A9A|nr:iron chelate uptake ABC transporter family permease subunit [Ensifer sp.]
MPSRDVFLGVGSVALKRAAIPVAFTALCVVSLTVGVNRMSLVALASLSDEAWLTLTASRLPRLAALVLTGVGLATCGVILQHVVRNRFVEPATTGGMEAAKLGILVALSVAPASGALVRASLALGFCFAASLIYVALVGRLQVKNTILVPVIGLMYGSVLGAIAEFYAYSRNMLQSMQGWLIGDFSKIVEGNYEIVWLILPVVCAAYAFAHRFTLLGMGSDMATSLGISHRAMVALGLLLVSTTVAATVVAVGAVPFVGLVVPNVVALRQGDNLARTLPSVALGGASLVLVCDILGRLLIYPFEVPIGLTMGGVGGLLFLFLIVRQRR